MNSEEKTYTIELTKGEIDDLINGTHCTNVRWKLRAKTDTPSPMPWARSGSRIVDAEGNPVVYACAGLNSEANLELIARLVTHRCPPK